MTPKKFYLQVEQDQLPICNQNTGARDLWVDDILKRTERSADSVEPHKIPVPWLSIIILVAFGMVMIWFLFR